MGAPHTRETCAAAVAEMHATIAPVTSAPYRRKRFKVIEGGENE